jgi:hypothetical protein
MFMKREIKCCSNALGQRKLFSTVESSQYFERICMLSYENLFNYKIEAAISLKHNVRVMTSEHLAVTKFIIFMITDCKVHNVQVQVGVF